MEDNSISIEHVLYIDKNFNLASNLLKNKFSNKHKCSRNTNCFCVNYGKMLIDIYLNDENIDKVKTPLIQYMSDYFISPEINLSHSLIVYMIGALIKLHYFNIAKSVIVNYLLYSTVSEIRNKPNIVSKEEVLYTNLV
jgi:hypothetical protein